MHVILLWSFIHDCFLIRSRVVLSAMQCLRWRWSECVQADLCLHDPLHEDYQTFRAFWELTYFCQLPCLPIIYISSFPRRVILQRVHFCVTKSLSNTHINEGLTLRQMKVSNLENRVSFNWVISAWNLSLMAQFLSVVHGCCWKEICASCLFRVFRSLGETNLRHQDFIWNIHWLIWRFQARKKQSSIKKRFLVWYIYTFCEIKYQLLILSNLVWYLSETKLIRLEITSDSVYSLRFQFRGQFRDFLFPFIMRIHPEANQTWQNNARITQNQNKNQNKPRIMPIRVNTH